MYIYLYKCQIIVRHVERLREMSPLWEMVCIYMCIYIIYICIHTYIHKIYRATC